MEITSPTQSEQNLQDYLKLALKAVSSHWRPMVVVFVTTLILVGITSLNIQRKYISEAKLHIKVGRESISLDPTATTGTNISMYESRESEIRSLVEMIGSYAVLERLVDQLGPEIILESSGDSKEIRAKATRELSKAISINRPAKSNVIAITAKSTSPEKAQKILTAFLGEFRELHILANKTDGSYDFFVTQTGQLEKELSKTNAQLSAVKTEIGVVALPEKRKVLEALNTELEKDKSKTIAELSSVEQVITALTKNLANLPQRQATVERDIPNVSLDPTVQLLHKLKIEEEQLLTRYTEFHPQVIELREQIEQGEKLLAANSDKRSEVSQDVNPTYQKLEEQLLTQQATAAGLRAKLGSLEQQFQDMKQQMQELNEQEGKITTLTNNLNVLQSKYSSYVAKREEARINQALEKDHISNVIVFQKPSYVPKPVSPKTSLVMAAGLVLATITSLVAALVLELPSFGILLPVPHKQKPVPVAVS